MTSSDALATTSTTVASGLAGGTGAAAVAPAPKPRALPTYTLPDTQLGMGASLGNHSVWVNTKGTGAIERVFSVALGDSLVGAITTRLAATGSSLHPAWLSNQHQRAETSYIPVRQDAPGTFELHPAYQRRRYSVAGVIDVSETVFVPLGEMDAPEPDPPHVYVRIALRNGDEYVHELRVVMFARLRGSLADDVQARFDPELRALVAHNRTMPRAVRIVGLSVPPTGHGTTFDFGSVYDPSHVHPLANDTSACGDILGALQLDLVLHPGERVEFTLVTGVYLAAERDAIEAFRRAPPAGAALESTITALQRQLGVAEVLTPDPQVNRGALWSKVNMRRVMHRYPSGWAFTNDPGVSSNVVIRDGAWFCYGNDHVVPEFSRALLERFAALQYPSGKLPEFFNAVTGLVEDDGLNINDDTPLFILAAHHHHRATGDPAWLARIAPAVVKAARYILSQRDERGLVVCTARDPRGGVWAIASWRNIIPNYSINGAVTEINAECAAALRAASELCAESGDPALRAVAGELRDESAALREAMNSRLLNPDTGLYYLNADVDGNLHTDVTGDEVFPVMFGVCDEETGFRIVSRLNSPDFWTPAGLRTASRNDPHYDPSAASGLLGGVWPGLTWWYAFAAGQYHPEFMVRALRSSFEHYAANPKLYNTVPGQFSEWFDGESLVNRGMRLSPWEPPRFLWAAVEGVCGLSLRAGAPRIAPLVPLSWKWVALRRVLHRGGELSYFVTRQHGRFHVCATQHVETDAELVLFESDVSADVLVFSDAATAVALKRPDLIVLMVGNVGSQTSTVPLNVNRIVDAHTRYETRVFNSERDAWEAGEPAMGESIGSLAISIETHGFRLIELRGRSG